MWKQEVSCMWKKIFMVFILTIIFSVVVGMNEEKAAAASYHSKAITVAESVLGIKYKWGGISPSTGFDCSGLVKYSFGKQGKSLPRTAAEMYKTGTKVSNDNSLKEGDLLFFAPSKAAKPTHVAIYVGDHQFIHSSSSKGVSFANTSNRYWKPRFIGAKRI